MINSHLLSNRTGHEPVGVERFELPTSVTRDFKSLVSVALKGYEVSNPTLTAKHSLLQGDAYRSHWLKANWPTPGFHPGNTYQQNAVEKASYQRINGTALGQLFTHKRNRLEPKARINGTAFTHKRNRLCGSKLEYPWPGGHSPVYTSITNNPILRTKPLFGCAKMRMN